MTATDRLDRPRRPSARNCWIGLFSFLTPALILLAAYAVFGMYPFGDKSVLIMDMSDQYVDFYAGLKHLFDGGQSIYFSWGRALGGNYIGVFAYYLASPLSFITLLFPDALLPLGLMILNLLKIGLCGLTFSLYLRYRFRRYDLSSIIFATLYALMSYTVVYSMCLMWLDGVIWLPVILIGIEKLLKGGRLRLLVISFFVCFVSNYYISYIVGLFSVVYFLYRYICTHRHSEWIPDFFKKLGRFAGSAVLAALLGAFLLLPTFFSLMQGKIGSGNYKPSGAFNFNLPDIMAKMLPGSYDSITYNNLPNIFCGLIVLVLVILFFCNRRFHIKEKIATAGVFALLTASFCVVSLDLVWHMLQYPNWFLYRYSFVFSFFALMVAYRSFTQIKHVPIWSFCVALFLLAFIFYWISDQQYKFLSETLLIFSLVLALVYIGLLVLHRKARLSKKRILIPVLSGLLLVCCCAETFINAQGLVNGLNKQFSYDTNASYVKNNEDLLPFVAYAKDASRDTFFRMDKTFERSKNEAINLGYNGLTHYSSAFNRNINQLMRNLGFAQFMNWCSYYGSTPVTDSLFSVKYVLSKDPMPSFYRPVLQQRGITMFENPYVLPLGFAVNQKAAAVSLHGNLYENQNRLVRALSGLDTQVFQKVESATLELTNVKRQQNGSYSIYKKTGNAPAITYRFKAPDSNPLYATVLVPSSSAGYLSVNGRHLGTTMIPDTRNSAVFIGQFTAGEEVTLRLELRREETKIQDILIYSLNTPALTTALAAMEENAWKLHEYGNGYVQGTITAAEQKLLFTTIPYEDGWTAEIDGKPVKTSAYADALVCVEVPQGQHEITLRYRSKGALEGMLISIFTAAGLFVVCSRKKWLPLFKRSVKAQTD